MKKRFLSVLLILSLCCLMLFPGVYAAEANYASDIAGHWGEKEISRWIDYGYIKGYQDGLFKPDRSITMAEFVTIVNRVLGLQNKSENNFSGIESSDWYAEEYAKARYEGYLDGYSDGSIKPNSFITRQEVMYIIANLLRYTKSENTEALSKIKDEAQVSEWCKTAVSEVIRNGYVLCYPDGTLRPAAPISRAEAVVVLNRAFGTIIRESDTTGLDSVTTTIKGNVTITKPDVTLQNTVIEGDLYCTAGIGEGEVIIKDSVIKGKTIISGGGINSVIFINTYSEKLFVYKRGGVVRILASGDTSLNQTVLETSAILEEDMSGGDGFNDIEIFTINPGDRVELNGSFNELIVGSQAVVEITGTTTVDNLQVDENSEGTQINLSGQAVVNYMELNSGTQVTGSGRVGTVSVNSDNTTVGVPVGKVVVGESVNSTKVGDTEYGQPGEYTVSGGTSGTGSSDDNHDDRENDDRDDSNSSPIASNDNAAVDEDGSVLIPVLQNDTDPNGDTLVIGSFTQGGHGSVVKDENRLLYTPAENYNGTDAFTYSVSDGKGGTATATVTVTVNGVNDIPEAADDAASVIEDGTVMVNVLGNDSDVDGDTLSITLFTQGSNGTVATEVYDASSLRYTPETDYNGTDSFTYTISDGNGGTATALVTVTVNAADEVNNAPVANADTASVAEDGTVLVDVLSNDSDADGDIISITLFTQGSHGTVIEEVYGLRYTPEADYNGADSFTYTISDGNGGTAAASVGVTVSSVNDAPVAVNDATVLNEDSTVLIDVLANDSDIDGDSLAIILFSQGAHGTVVQEGGSMRYTPAATYNGTDSFTYTISDGNGGTAAGTVNITVNSVNDVPEAVNDNITVNEDSTVLVDVLANDTDVDGDILSITGFTQGTCGTVAQEGGSLRYTPAANYNGADSFTYTISDGNGGTATGTVNVTVNSVNDVPEAVNDNVTVNEDSTVLVDVLANDTDVDGDILSITGFTQGTRGTVAQEGGSLRYTPAANYNGADSFTYTISDGNGGTATGTVNVTVNSVNDTPVANNDNTEVDQDSTVLIDVLANDTDVDENSLSITGFTQGTHGTVAQESDSLRYTPAAAFYGADSFTYTISDGNGGTASATVNVTVNGPLLSMDIDYAGGMTDYIQLNISETGTYEIKTSFYMQACDTVVYLYDAGMNMIAVNDDYVDLYGCIIMNLNPGTYYIVVEDFDMVHVYCHLEVNKL